MTTNRKFALLAGLAVCAVMGGLMELQPTVAFAQGNATGAGNQTGNQTGNQSSLANSATSAPASGQQAGTPDY